jgi:hypothetical protein
MRMSDLRVLGTVLGNNFVYLTHPHPARNETAGCDEPTQRKYPEKDEPCPQQS